MIRTAKRIAQLRRSHDHHELSEKTAPADPLVLFERWLGAAMAADPSEPNAMTLATATRGGVPACRTVLLKDYSKEGFIFFTNYGSRKARELAENPRAALLFYWPPSSRQVTIEGRTRKVPRRQSEEYFRTRPRNSQIAAHISTQSRPVASRAALMAAWKEFAARYENRIIPCPKNWGGYVLRPSRVEFWQGRPDRLHDRLVYILKKGRWQRVRLAP